MTHRPAENQPGLLAMAAPPDNQTLFFVFETPSFSSKSVGAMEANDMSAHVLKGLFEEGLAYGANLEIRRSGIKPAMIGRSIGYQDDFEILNHSNQFRGFGRIDIVESKPSIYLIIGFSESAPAVAAAREAITATFRLR